MSDQDNKDAIAAADAAADALKKIGAAVTEMKNARSKVDINVAYDKIGPLLQTVETKAFDAYKAKIRANSGAADDASGRAGDDLIKAQNLQVAAKKLLDEKAPTLP